MSNLLNLWREVCGRSVAISTNRRAFSGEDIALLSSEIEKALADAVNSGIGIVRVAPASMLAAAPTPAAQSAGQEAVAQSFGMTRAGLIKTYPMVEMGFGEVCVGDGYVEDIPALTFSPQEFQPIGTQTVYEPLKEIPVAEVLCAITFANVESLDVVMRTLADVRKKFDAAPVNGGERAIVDAAIAWADGKPDSMKACAALVNAVASYKGERAADAQQVGGDDRPVFAPLVEPVTVKKAMLAGRKARAVLSGGTGPVAAVHLVNIGVTGWVHTAETAEAYANGFNRGANWMQSALTSPAKVPGAVMQALDRMSTPLHDSRLSGLTAELDAANIKTIRDYVLSGAVPAKVVGDDQHPDDAAVDRFSVAMKAKLAKKRAQGRGGWDDERICSPDDLARMLVDHVRKGDPVDVGNLAMMLFNRPDAGAALCRAALSADGGDRKDADYPELYRWLANRVLACDYGDNDAPGEQIGWRIRGDLRDGEPFMFGSSIDEAIRAAIAASTAKGDA